MILEYNYDNGNLVLDLFKKSALATLEIKTVQEKRIDAPLRFVMEYTLVEDYPEDKQVAIRKILSESLNERLQTVNVINKFIENAILNNVKAFNLSFNTVMVRKCEIFYSSSYGANSVATPQSDIAKLTQCLEQFDSIITSMGVAQETVPGVFKREGTGKNKKNVPLNIADLAAALRHALVEE